MTVTNGDLMRHARARTLAESRILRESLDPTPAVPVPLTYRFSVTCPACGGPLRHVTGSADPRVVGLESKVVTECGPCRDTFIIHIQVAGQARANRARHGLQLDTALWPTQPGAAA